MTLKSAALDMEEHERLERIPIEIQITTLLAYAWGQIEHDRSYKTVMDLRREDSDIPRRFKLISGALEILDNEFERLSRDTERYANDISSKIDKGEIDDILISPLSLRKFLTMKFWDVPGFRAYFQRVDEILDELVSMDIKTLTNLNMIMPRDFKERLTKVSKSKDFVTFTAIIRDILIIHDPEKYFSKAWKHHYNAPDYHSWKVYDEFRVDKTKFPSNDEFEFEHGSDED